jgi:response regulator RpfG family c-di-GMP phosphodiesterase
MAQVILVEADAVVADLYSLNLRNYVGADVVVRHSAVATIEILHSHPSIDLIIVRHQIGEEKSALEIYKYLKGAGRNIPMIVIGREALIEKFSVQLPVYPEIKDVLKNAALALGITPEDMVKVVVDDYVMTPAYYFLILEEMVCDVFIKVRTGAGYEHQKKFSKGTRPDTMAIKDLIRKGIKNFYVEKSQRLKFTNQVTVGLLKKISSNALTTSERMNFASSGMEIIREEFMKDGPPSPEVIELMELSISSVQEAVAQSPSLKKLLEDLLSNKHSWVYQHCQLITFICTLAIDKLKWGGPDQQKLMAFVAFFHDIVFNRDELSKVSSEEQLKQGNFSEKDQELILKHALTCAKMLEKFTRTPMGAETIIKQHHGSIVGIGFPKHYSNNLSPLAILFLLAEELAAMIITHGKSSGLKKDFFLQLRKKYPRSMYQKVIDAFTELF